MASEQFVEVKRKKGRSNRHQERSYQQPLCSLNSASSADSVDVDISRIVRRIRELRDEVYAKEMSQKVIEDVETWLINLDASMNTKPDKKGQSDKEKLTNSLDGCEKHDSECTQKPEICCGENGSLFDVDIVCYGLGCVTTCPIAREQTALLLELKERQCAESSCYCYDPHFKLSDCHILRQFGSDVIDRNEEGKRPITRPTIFFMPHCGKALYNNLLWANWETDELSKLFIIGNSFSAMNERLPQRIFEKEYHFIFKILPLVLEEPFLLTPHTETAFSDTSCHWIPQLNLVSKPVDFWTRPEPSYSEEDVEIICKNDKS
ncbi:SRR1-like protein [Lineus longissimus]|uniref:SRR1-like protein n=1 Tax=Lineus longissimus TaxID=88925 RepID=UPI002B4EF683